jgi:hypothetical protein
MSEQGKPATPVPPPAQPEERGEPQLARQPEYKAHYGRVQAAVWRRESDGRTSYSVSLTRSYKDKSDQWQRTTNLDEEGLLPAAKALDDAYTWIQRQRHQVRDGAFHELNVPPRAANS